MFQIGLDIDRTCARTSSPERESNAGGKFRPSPYGAAFREETGKLYLFSPRDVVVQLAWPGIRAWRKTRGSPVWRHVRPKLSGIEIAGACSLEELIDMPGSGDTEGMPQSSSPTDTSPRRGPYPRTRWMLRIPADVRGAVSVFRDRAWHLLSFIARCGSPALDLTVANPALAYALASNWCYHLPAVRRPLRAARAQLRRRQREILGWLGFPATEAMRRVLRKTAAETISIPLLLYLRQSMESPAAAKALAHLPRINAGAARIVTDPALLPFATPVLLAEAALHREDDRRPVTAYMLRDTLNMHRILHPAQPQPAIRDRARLRDLHDELIDELNLVGPGNLDLEFPPPPVPGTAAIRPIQNAHELLEEGRSQHHCIFSYLHEVAVQLRAYIYRTIPPLERGTLSLVRSKGGWRLGDIRLSCNRPVSESTRRRVAEWLRKECPDETGHVQFR